MGATETAARPAVTPTTIRPPKFAHCFPDAVRGNPRPWVSLCGAKTITDADPGKQAPPGTERCVVCTELNKGD